MTERERESKSARETEKRTERERERERETCRGWRRLIGSPKMQIIFHKRATKYRALLRKMTYKDKGYYESLPPCRERERESEREMKRANARERARESERE